MNKWTEEKPKEPGVNPKITGKYKVCVFSVSYENASWKYVIASMAGYLLQPIVIPIMILLSKLLKRKIEWFPVEHGDLEG